MGPEELELTLICAGGLAALPRSLVARLLDQVRYRSGGVIELGEHGLLACFIGQRHEQRGAAAALGTTVIGRRQLAVGVASGCAELSRPGAGPLADEVHVLQAAAGPGEVLASFATARAVPPLLWDGRSGPGVLLRGARPAHPRGGPGGRRCRNSDTRGPALCGLAPIFT